MATGHRDLIVKMRLCDIDPDVVQDIQCYKNHYVRDVRIVFLFPIQAATLPCMLTSVPIAA
jgi:hypothetical protein